MRLQSKLLMILLLWRVERTTQFRSLVYQKEMSEYCRRRVIPSVFLGTHVAEAHSKILYFSKMELPYSCFISVRGELGSNLILVAQLTSDNNLISACDYFPNQLLVYEMGETFGGYWGPLPETLMRPTATAQTLYVHKDRKHSTKRLLSATSAISTTTSSTTPAPVPTEPKPDVVQVEIPLLDVTAHLDTESGDGNGDVPVPLFQIEDNFDMLFDVTPRAHEQYVTTELPLLQFSADENINGRRFGTDTLFDLEYDDGLPTSDTKLPHLSLRTSTKKKSSIRKTYGTIHTYTKQKPLFTMTRKHKTYSKPQLYGNETSHSAEPTWEHIDDLLKGLNESRVISYKDIDESENITRMLESLSKLKHNYSLYLHPNWKSMDNNENYQMNNLNKHNFSLFTRTMFPHLTSTTRSIHQLLKSTAFFNFTNNFSTKATDSNNKNAVNNKMQLTAEHSKKIVENNFTEPISNFSMNEFLNETTFKVLEHTSEMYNVTLSSVSTQVTDEVMNKNIQSDSTISTTARLSGTMVDHESWENVVQAAPVMAVLLNSTATQNNVGVNITSNENATTVMRKKRRILPIPIEDARPHEMTTRERLVTTQSDKYYASDVQEFAQLVELQDDELHDRVALRYLRQYVGPTLFNICDFSEPKTRHIFLFNSSRIVIAISNFTLERMSVILTPARTLVGGSSKCPDWRLECQVFGTRVCIDKINACDGVPNCGAHDIYDEDRLTCGAAEGLQHNLYLVAFTFIAVLLTMLFIVHYWLRRCVPRVSEAFFVYTDRAENTLYLETIMRSPHDIGDNTNLYHGNLFMPEDTLDIISKHVKQSIGFKMWRCCFAFITCKCIRKRHPELKLEIGPVKPISSFAELELKQMGTSQTVDESVQTGGSLEMSYKKKNTFAKKYQPQQHNIYEMPTTSSSIEIRKQSHELHILKLLKESKSHCKVPCKCVLDSPEETSLEEKELYSHNLQNVPTFIDVKPPKPQKLAKKPEVYCPRPVTSKHVVKHLRFDEEPVTIPTSDIEDEEVPIERFLGGDDITLRKHHDAEKAEDEPGPSRDFRRFWSKKGRKKKNLPLH